MAVRIRADGEILCAATHPEAPGDTYLDDSIHYVLSVELRVLRPLPHGRWEFGPRGCHDLGDVAACEAHNR